MGLSSVKKVTWLLSLGACLLLALACRNGDAPGAPTNTAGPGTTPTPTAVCLGEGFRESGELASFGGPAGPAEKIADLRWARHEGCERFVIEFARADGSAASTIGDVRVQFLRDIGVVRINLPNSIVSTDETDIETGGELVAGAFVFRPSGGGATGMLSVDLHLGRAALARVTRVENPARIVVDVQPGGAALASTPVRSGLTVVLRPTRGDGSYPLEITGYARHFEANVVARIRQGGTVRAMEFTTGTDWTEVWGFYTIRITSGPTGSVELFVGEDSARDGTEQGVRVNLNMR